jgi:NAD(P)-dependent dehydrogenase (short-subunit alcohol dehydrogenase family)
MGSRSVLVTGASSGIGRECALLLAARGFQVFAGVRRPEDGDSLVGSARGTLVPVMLEVTDEASIRSAADAVARGLAPGASFCLVNNAGISVAGPLELLSIDSFRQQLEVSVVGQVAVTQAFLPILRARSGRIVIMGSLFGRISLPFVAPYAAAKFALEALADSLSMELRDWGIDVVLLEPGSISTPIWTRSKDLALRTVGGLGEDRLGLYRDALETFEKATDRFAARGIPPVRVARAAARALTARRPRSRYRVGWDARLLGTLGPLLPGRLRQRLIRLVVLRR